MVLLRLRCAGGPLCVLGIENRLRTPERGRHEMTVCRVRDVDIPMTQPLGNNRAEYRRERMTRCLASLPRSRTPESHRPKSRRHRIRPLQ
jgi:hypothetical protein